MSTTSVVRGKKRGKEKGHREFVSLRSKRGGKEDRINPNVGHLKLSKKEKSSPGMEKGKEKKERGERRCSSHKKKKRTVELYIFPKAASRARKRGKEIPLLLLLGF